MVDDYVTLGLLVSSAFFVALSIGLLYRYRQVSQRISESSDLGRDLWSSLEQRLKKQDERIIDMMARFEVIQSRSLVSAPPPTPLAFPPAQVAPPPPSPSDIEETATQEAVTSTVVRSTESQPESRQKPASQPVTSVSELDETERAAIDLLSKSPMNTRQITDALKKSREHTARIMKTLFDSGLVSRNDSTKPFVYQLTDEGRRYLSAS